MRKQFHYTDEQVEELRTAGKMSELEALGYLIKKQNPIAIMQEATNAIWVRNGKKMGFDGMTAMPVDGDYKNFNDFTAEEAPIEEVIEDAEVVK